MFLILFDFRVPRAFSSVIFHISVSLYRHHQGTQLLNYFPPSSALPHFFAAAGTGEVGNTTDLAEQQEGSCKERRSGWEDSATEEVGAKEALQDKREGLQGNKSDHKRFLKIKELDD